MIEAIYDIRNRSDSNGNRRNEKMTKRNTDIGFVVVGLLAIFGTTPASAQYTGPIILPELYAYAADITGGLRHSCMVDTCGHVECWGDDSYEKLDAPEGSFEQVAAGAYHTCGLRSDGEVVCWGNNGRGQLNVPSLTFGEFEKIEAGIWHTCATTTRGEAICWGNGQTSVPDGLGGRFGRYVIDVSAGYTHSCALVEDVAGPVDILCWGYQPSNNVPFTYQPLFDAHMQVAAGRRHTCTVSEAGRLKCWGDDRYGQTSGIGLHPDDAAVEDFADPGVFIFPKDWLEVGTGQFHTCALDKNTSEATCWGYDSQGSTSAPSGSFETLGVGDYHACGILESGTIECWGNDSYGQATPPSLPRQCMPHRTTPDPWWKF